MAFVNGLLQEDALGFWGNQIFTVGLLVHCRVQDDFFFFFFFFYKSFPCLQGIQYALYWSALRTVLTAKILIVTFIFD